MLKISVQVARGHVHQPHFALLEIVEKASDLPKGRVAGRRGLPLCFPLSGYEIRQLRFIHSIWWRKGLLQSPTTVQELGCR